MSLVKISHHDDTYNDCNTLNLENLISTILKFLCEKTMHKSNKNPIVLYKEIILSLKIIEMNCEQKVRIKKHNNKNTESRCPSMFCVPEHSKCNWYAKVKAIMHETFHIKRKALVNSIAITLFLFYTVFHFFSAININYSSVKDIETNFLIV